VRGDLADDVVSGFVSQSGEGEGGGGHGAEWRTELMAESRTESRAELTKSQGKEVLSEGMGLRGGRERRISGL
jgi:hypothetical protein